MDKFKSYILIEYVGELPIVARLESGAEKVEFSEGDIHYAEKKKADHLCGAYKFKMVNPVDISADQLKTAQKRLQKIKDANEALEKEQAEMRKVEGAKKEKEAEMRVELAEIKEKYNKKEFTGEEYEEARKEITEKWAKKFEGKAEKKPAKKEKEEVKEEKVEEDLSEGSKEQVEQDKEDKKAE